MTKKKKWEKIWVNQSELGREFGLSAVMLGRKMTEIGLRKNRQPTQHAFDDGLVVAAPLANGTPNFRWHKQKTIAVLVAAGLTRQSADDVREAEFDAEAKEIARYVLRMESSPDGIDQKLAYLMWGETPAHLRDRVDALIEKGR
jgi:hypothetical protein